GHATAADWPRGGTDDASALRESCAGGPGRGGGLGTSAARRARQAAGPERGARPAAAARADRHPPAGGSGERAPEGGGAARGDRASPARPARGGRLRGLGGEQAVTLEQFASSIVATSGLACRPEADKRGRLSPREDDRHVNTRQASRLPFQAG